MASIIQIEHKTKGTHHNWEPVLYMKAPQVLQSWIQSWSLRGTCTGWRTCLDSQAPSLPTPYLTRVHVKYIISENIHLHIVFFKEQSPIRVLNKVSSSKLWETVLPSGGSTWWSSPQTSYQPVQKSITMVGLLGWRTLVNVMCPQVMVTTHVSLTWRARRSCTCFWLTFCSLTALMAERVHEVSVFTCTLACGRCRLHTSINTPPLQSVDAVWGEQELADPAGLQSLSGFNRISFSTRVQVVARLSFREV